MHISRELLLIIALTIIQEDTLSDVAKKAGGFALGAIIGKGGSKFGGLDIKRVYFGCVYWPRIEGDKLTYNRIQKLVT